VVGFGGKKRKMIDSEKLIKRLRGRNYNQSFLRKLKKEGKVTRELENLISILPLEDLIALKLEIAAKSVKGKFFGFPLMAASKQLIKEAFIKFALSSTSSHKNAAFALGISLGELKRYIKKYEINKSLDS